MLGATAFRVIWFARVNSVQWLHELKAMTIDIVMSHNGTDSLSATRKLNLQFDLSTFM